MAAFPTPVHTALSLLSRPEQPPVTLRTSTPVVHALYPPSTTQTTLPPRPGHQDSGLPADLTGYLATMIFVSVALVILPFVMGVRLRDICITQLEYITSRLSATFSSVCFAIQTLTFGDMLHLPGAILAKGCAFITFNLSQAACSCLNVVPIDQYRQALKDGEELQNTVDTFRQARVNSRGRRKLEISKQTTATSYLNSRLSASSVRTKRLTQENDDAKLENAAHVNDKLDLATTIDSLTQEVDTLQQAKDTTASVHKEELKAKDLAIFQIKVRLWIAQIIGRDLEAKNSRMTTQEVAHTTTIDRLTQRLATLENEKDVAAATHSAKADSKTLEVAALTSQLSAEQATIESLRIRDEATTAENALLRATVVRLEEAAAVAVANAANDSNAVELLKEQLAAKSNEVEQLTCALQVSPELLALESRRQKIAESLRAANAMLSDSASSGAGSVTQHLPGLTRRVDRVVTPHEPSESVRASNVPPREELSTLLERAASATGPRHSRRVSLPSVWDEPTSSSGASGSQTGDDEELIQVPLLGRRRERTAPSGWRFGAQCSMGPQKTEEPLESEGTNEGIEGSVPTAHAHAHATFPSLSQSSEMNLAQLPVAFPISPPYTPFAPFAGQLPRIGNSSSSATTPSMPGNLHSPSTEHQPLGLQLLTTPLVGDSGFVPPTMADGRIRLLVRPTTTVEQAVGAGALPPRSRPRLNLTGGPSDRLFGSATKAIKVSSTSRNAAPLKPCDGSAIRQAQVPRVPHANSGEQ